MQPSIAVSLQAAVEGQSKASLTASFRLAPQQPEVGQPGKTPGDVLLVTGADGGHTALVSLGPVEKCDAEAVRRAGGGLGKWLINQKVSQIDLDLDSLEACGVENAAEALCEGIRLGSYQFIRLKKQDEPVVEAVAVLRGGKNPAQNEAVVRRVNAVTGAVIMARDLAHEPANIINPITLAARAQEIAEKNGLKIKVLDDETLTDMGAGGIVAVGKGSQTPSRLIVLEYDGGAADQQPIALVGKAITFDTGGYSLKGSQNITGMKYDKCGGVAVLAVMQAAAELQLKTRLVGIIGAAENMISGYAYRPDDILTSLSGKTIEIVSTDAEGRLVLADALTYAQREYAPKAMIDLATLTGGVVVALGHVRAGLLSNDDELANALFAAGERTHERLWRLPLDDEFSKLIKGDDADLKNSGGRGGHCILGGSFLKAFIEDGTAWAHLDIAGTAGTDSDLPYAPKGATGFGVRLLIDYLESL